MIWVDQAVNMVEMHSELKPLRENMLMPAGWRTSVYGAESTLANCLNFGVHLTAR